MRYLSTFAMAAVLGFAVSFTPGNAQAAPAPLGIMPGGNLPITEVHQSEATELAARPYWRGRYWRGPAPRNYYRNYYRNDWGPRPYYRPYGPARPYYGPGFYFRLG